jgi:ABC-type dipeptide/oligopeptide/nickel transport system permease subunit
VSLAIGALATVLAIALGIAVGSLAALGGPIADMVLMRLTEALMAFPRLLLILVASTLWRLDLVALVLLLGTTSWMETARLTRAQVLHELRAGYVEAAIVSGLPRGRILLRHLLPNALSPLLADAALRVGDVILLEAALSYLGFGVPVPTASWGRMVADGEELFESAWWLATLPGICIVAAVLGFTLIADGLRDRLDPTLAEAK